MGPGVVTADRDAIRRLYTGDPRAKHNSADPVRPLLGDRSLFLIGPDEHLARRRLLLPPFHGERVRGYAELMQRLMREEVAHWAPGDTVRVLPLAQNVTIEVILQAVLGVADRELRERLRRSIDAVLFYPFGAGRLALAGRLGAGPRMPHGLREAAAFAGSLSTPAVTTYFPEIKTRDWWNVATHRWWHHRDGLMAVLDEQITTTRADPRLDEREDILAMLVRARDEDGRGLSDEDLQEDLLGLIAAGHETTAASIAWGAALLAHHPEIQERAVEGDERYRTALVKELLRLRSPVLIAGGRALAEPFEIGSFTLPPGTPIFIDAWGVHHDPEIYPDPERFDPERFLGEGPPPYAWVPFGGGAHRCLGAALAELEIAVGLGTMLEAATLEPADARLAPGARRGITLVPHGGGRVRIAARASGAARPRELAAWT
jgi:cytochrome P450